MIFKALTLYTNNLENELKFYSEKLGFEVISQNNKSFTLKIGWSELTFENSDQDYKYHYCFLIPSNKLDQAIRYMETQTDLIDIEDGKKIQNFESWNADSFYFFDASKNVVEFIVRYDLDNSVNSEFDLSMVLGVNEMGVPTGNIKQLNSQLEDELQSTFWKGDLERFGTNGTQKGILLLPNYNLKDVWFPTNVRIQPNPFKAVVINNEKQYQLSYNNETLSISKID